MKIRNWVRNAMLCGCLLGIIPAVRAENWVDTKHEILIDVDSIHQKPDGLVYYRLKYRTYDENDNRVWSSAKTAAYDCEKRLGYSSYLMSEDPKWKSKGEKVIPGTMGEVLLDFVCSRVKR
jgi:hypothetical protein